MQINRYLDIYGGVTLEDMGEGRFAYIYESNINGALGVKLPDTEAEAARANLCVAWTPTNIDPPYYTPMPSVTWALRKGWDRAENDPFDASVSMVYPGFRDTSTIPSGTLVRLFPGGSVVTLTSGNFIPSDQFHQGAPVSISYSGADAGKPQYQTEPPNDLAGTIARVNHYDAANLILELRIR